MYNIMFLLSLHFVCNAEYNDDWRQNYEDLRKRPKVQLKSHQRYHHLPLDLNTEESQIDQYGGHRPIGHRPYLQRRPSYYYHPYMLRQHLVQNEQLKYPAETRPERLAYWNNADYSNYPQRWPQSQLSEQKNIDIIMLSTIVLITTAVIYLLAKYRALIWSKCSQLRQAIIGRIAGYEEQVLEDTSEITNA